MEEDRWGYAPSIAQIWRARGDHKDDFAKTKLQIKTLSNKATWSGPHGWAYGDMMMTGGEGCEHWDAHTHTHPASLSLSLSIDSLSLSLSLSLVKEREIRFWHEDLYSSSSSPSRKHATPVSRTLSRLFRRRPQHCPKQTNAEYRTEVSLYSVLSSPMMIGTDLRARDRRLVSK